MSAELTVDLQAVVANWRALAGRAAPAACAAVVKADAYGLGAGAVAVALARAGARTFFVALTAEGAALREALGPGPAIYVLNGFAPADAEAVAAATLRPVLSTPTQVAALSAALPTAACAIQIETGMNRLGAPAAVMAAALAEADLGPDLLMSHLACADDPPDPMNAAQRAAFETAFPAFPGLRRSLAATGGALMGPSFAYDLIRPGIGLYGGSPFTEARSVARVTADVLQIRDLAPGERVGYGASFRAGRPTRVATIAIGYADGLPRALSGRGTAHRGGAPLPFLGRVSMDLTTVDASAAPDLREGDAVEVLGPSQGVDALAAQAGTIGYEILTALGRRLPRRYEGGTFI